MKHRILQAMLAGVLLAATAVDAQTISVASATGSPGGGTTPTPIPVTFTRNSAVPIADFTARVTFSSANFVVAAAGANGGSCAVNQASGFVTVLPPPGGTDTPTNVYCNLTLTINAGVAAGNYPLGVTTSFGGGGCFDNNANLVPCTLTPGTLSVVAAALGPSLAYAPGAGATAGTGGPVNFTGVTVVGTTGAGQIAVTPSGGAASGTTTLGSFTLTGADAASFALTSAATLTFTAGVSTVQNVTLSCTSGANARTANLQATETITGGATTQRFWVLNCPAGSPIGPSLAYAPTAGASAGTGGPVNFTGVTIVGSTGSGQIAVTPSGGAASGTTTLGSFTLSGADAAAFARTSAATLTFTAGVPTVQNITLTCTSAAAARTANLQATETITGGATTQRFWVLSCPAGAPVGPTLAYNPAAGASAGTGGPVNFTGVTTVGTSGNGQIVVTPSGGAASGTTTLDNFTLSGADAASFTRTSAATLTFTAGVATAQNITLTCVSGAAARTANLQATETVSGGATTQRFWVLNCPAGTPVGPSLSYSPSAGASAGTGGPVGFTGVTTVGTTGNGQIVVTPSGGAAAGTTTLGSFTITGADAAAFTRTSAATLTFTAGVVTAQNITLTCTSAATLRTANLQATETITGGATTQRFWVLNCPAGGAVPVGPTLAYTPAAGATSGTGGPVTFTGVTTIGSTGNGVIDVTPSGGAASGTTTLGSFTITGADAASFARTSAATLTFTAGVATPQSVTLTCTSGSTLRTANLQATETITGGATSQRFWVLNCPAGTVTPVGPAISYSPTAGASAGTGGPVSFSGVTTVGTSGTGQIVATPSGGAASGTTTLGSFTLSGADAASFSVTSAATLTFTAGITTPQNVTLSCVSGAGARTANLQATETIANGATSQRFWVLSCPAGTPVGPNLAYNPAAGASAGTGGPVNFTGVTTVGTAGSGLVVVTPSGGAGAGTTTLGSFVLSGADAASFTVTSANTLTFTAGVPTAQNLTLSCVSGASARTANLQATETISGGATAQRFWVLACPAGSPIGPSLGYNPAAGAGAGTGGPVNFTGVTTVGSTGSGQIVVSPTGGAASGITTLGSFTLSGTDAAFFTRTSAATLTFTAGVATAQNVTLTCTSGSSARTANLQATETVTGGATAQRFWVLNCPAGAATPTGPSLSYAPAAGATAGTGGPVTFTGITNVGTIGAGLVTVTPSGGAGGGTTSLTGFAISGVDATSFAVSSASSLTFTAGVAASQSITLNCLSGTGIRTANLSATETITNGATTQRFWVLTCPSGAGGNLFQNGFEPPDPIYYDGFEGFETP